MLSDRAKHLLGQLDECLVDERDSTAEDLWAVLTALRGPDSVDSLHTSDLRYEVKPSTTGVIRQKVFPKASDRGVTGVSRTDNGSLVKVRREIQPIGHFLNHSINAFRALGLEWYELNK